MISPVFITGQAGTGRTTRLMDLTGEYGSRLVAHEYQRILAMTLMHGARRRVEASLDKHEQCRTLRRSVSTIDSFALSLVNRWRSSLGIALPIDASQQSGSPRVEKHFRTHTHFADIVQLALQVLTRVDARKYVSDTYPVILVDEFQDVHGDRLAFIQTLAVLSQLLLAADAFQLLDTNIVGCPAIEWIAELEGRGEVIVENLIKPRRTANPQILEAARCLREKRQGGPAVPVFFGAEAQIAFRIVDHLVFNWYAPRWTGTCAIISPVRSGLIDRVLASIDSQLRKRNFQPIHWTQNTSEDHDEVAILEALGLKIQNQPSEGAWVPRQLQKDARAIEITKQVQQFAKLRGLTTIPCDLVALFARKYAHTHRSYGHASSWRVATTVHGAKNREFDHVFVLWPYNVRSDQEQQRRLLYNAVTRAKKECIIFSGKRESVARADEVLSLLGPVQSLSPPRQAKGTKTTKVKRSGGKVAKLQQGQLSL
ncbi:MAG: ATP-dependent helicase [Acidobacteriia bacterium]|nr:ATP-dependent helicase [Terriglobia bacterium]